jgi:hypothetical protein
MDVVVPISAVSQTMDQPRIAVEGEDDRLISGEQGIEIVIRQTVRVLARRLQFHQVYDIDDSNFQIGRVLA